MKIFLIVISSLFFLKNIQGQDIEQVYRFAVKNSKEENYNRAIHEFERVFYFDTESNYRKKVTIELAHCYLKTQEFEKALKFYDLAYGLTQNDSLKNEIIFKKVFIYILQKEYLYAEVELLNTFNTVKYNQEKQENFLFGLTYYGQNKYNDSKKYFNHCFETEQSKSQIDSLFNILGHIKPSWPAISKYMSMILPGSGQLANASVKSAVNSFVLTFSILTLYAYTAANYTLYDAVISVLPWFARYHRGGYENAYRIALLKQEEKRNNILIQIIDLYEK
ncbi:MAG: hypothetical protein GXO79_13035 [Chlorobi bacterium]|nr:hypothetical protein [Chlorobiota bacterium]